jgi:5-methylcytosine-specific restriction endonuclease McrA
MGKKLPYTPSSQIRNALRQLWLRSRERSAAVKREHNTCERCGRKGSVAKGREVKIEVHHRAGIGNWEMVIQAIRQHLLTEPEGLEVLCQECHKKETEEP